MTQPQAAEPEFYISEDMARAAIFGNQTLPIKFSVSKDIELELNVYWPNADDDDRIKQRATQLLGGIRPELVTDNDFYVARGRAVVETLVANPLPQWLTGPNNENLIGPVEWRGKQSVRPDTGKVKSSRPFALFWLVYNEVISRFLPLVFE